MKTGKSKFNKLLSLMLMMAFVMFSITSCDDDDGAVTNTQLLTSAPWIFQSLSTGDAMLDASLSLLFNGFNITFSADGTYTVNFPADPTSGGPGVWRFNVEETQLVLDEGTTNELVITIITLNSTTFVFTITEDVGAGPIPITLTTTH